MQSQKCWAVSVSQSHNEGDFCRLGQQLKYLSQKETIESNRPNGGATLVSDRVQKLKREIEDLDEKLQTTNSINLKDIRAEIQAEGNHLSSDEDEKENKGLEIEQHILKKKDLNLNKSPSSSKQHPVPLHNSSHLSCNEGEVSFDYEKIVQQRNQNLRAAMEVNMREKKEQIQLLQTGVSQVTKEFEAKTLKLTHLKYEKENLIGQMMEEGAKKQEESKGLKSELKRIEIKKKEDSRAYQFAQEELKRSITAQQKQIIDLKTQIKVLQQKLLTSSTSEPASQQNFKLAQRDLKDSISQLQVKVSSLSSKKEDLQKNQSILKDYLRQAQEEIQMTEEDLNSKLIQRAEFVAQREELDQMFEQGKAAFGKEFEVFAMRTEGAVGEQAAQMEYYHLKVASFCQDIIHQLKQLVLLHAQYFLQSKEKHHEKLDQLLQKIEVHGRSMELDKTIQLLIDVSQKQLGITLDQKLLLKKFQEISSEKDILFEEREEQLKEILKEIARFEKATKANSNLIDNMLVPQLKAMSATFSEHKQKYRKLKQACQLISERLMKSEMELQDKTQELQRIEAIANKQQDAAEGLNKRIADATQKLREQEEEMCRLNENAEQVEKEFRRAQQALLLKEREVQHKLRDNNDTLSESSQQLNMTGASASGQDEKVKKKLAEIERRVQATEGEKLEIERRLKELTGLLKEAKDSYFHAQQIMASTQRIMQQQKHQKQLLQQTDELKKLRPEMPARSNHCYPDEYQITSMTDPDFQNTQVHPGIRTLPKNRYEENKEQRFGFIKQDKENSASYSSLQLPYQQQMQEDHLQFQKQQRPEMVSKIDLSKVFMNEESQEAILHQSMGEKASKEQESTYQSSQQELCYTNNAKFRNTNNSSYILKGNSKQATIGTCDEEVRQSMQFPQQREQPQLEACFKQFLQQTNSSPQMKDYSQLANLSSSVLNISDLGIQSLEKMPRNNPKQGSQLTFNNTCNEESQNWESNPLHNNSLLILENIVNTGPFQQSQVLGNDQSSIVDMSLVQCLDDLNQRQDCHQTRQQRSSSLIKRSSIETADFFQGKDEDKRRQIATIDIEINDRLFGNPNLYMKSPEMIGDKKKNQKAGPVNQFQVGTENGYYREPVQISQEVSLYDPQMSLLQSSSYPMFQEGQQDFQRFQIKPSMNRQRVPSYNDMISSYISSQGKSYQQAKQLNQNSLKLRQSLNDSSISPQPVQRARGSKERKGSSEQRYWGGRSTSVEQRGAKGGGYQPIPNAQFHTLHHQSCQESSHSRSNSRFIKKNHKLNKSLNNGDQSLLIRSSIQSSLNNVLKSSQHHSSCSSQYPQNESTCQPSNDLLNFTRVECQFADRILPLLQETSFYKKFSSRQGLGENTIAFDPLQADKFPPEACGYGIRVFQLDRNLGVIHVKQSLKNQVEFSIHLSEIVKPILPQTTMDIIKTQKQYQMMLQSQSCKSKNPHLLRSITSVNHSQNCSQSSKDLLEEFLILDTKGSGISHLAKIGILNKNSDLYKHKCLNSTFYPFSIALTHGRVELVATSYETLKNWIIGINLMVGNKKHLAKVKQLIDARW